MELEHKRMEMQMEKMRMDEESGGRPRKVCMGADANVGRFGW